jgi:hypothetical protein
MYSDAGTAACEVETTEKRKGVLGELERSCKALSELRIRISALNVGLSGPRPENGNKPPAQIEPRFLESRVASISSLIQHCHDELTGVERSLGL